MENKKGQLGSSILSLVMLAIGFVVVIVIVLVGISMSATTSQITLSQIPSFTLANINEQITIINGTDVRTAHAPIITGTLSIRNTTTTFNLSNFTIDYTNGLIKLVTNNISMNNTVAFLNYTSGYPTLQTELEGGVVNAATSYSSFTDYLQMVALVFVLSVVVGALLAVMITFFTAFRPGAGSGGGGAF